MIAGLIAGAMPWVVRHGIVIGIIAASVVALLIWDHQRANRLRSEGAAKVVEDSRKAGVEKNEKVRKIRRSVPRDGAWERLRREYGQGD